MTADPRPSTEAGRALLAQAIHERHCYHTCRLIGGTTRFCEDEATAILATPSGQALARLATPGSELPAIRAFLGDIADQDWDGGQAIADRHLYEAARDELLRHEALARLATAGPDEPTTLCDEHGWYSRCRRCGVTKAAGTSEPHEAFESGWDVGFKAAKDGMTGTCSMHRWGDDSACRICYPEAAGPSEREAAPCAYTSSSPFNVCGLTKDARLHDGNSEWFMHFYVARVALTEAT